MEPLALRCPSCAAAVGREDVRCTHCGSQLATVACPNCFGLVPLRESHCGHCGAAVAPQEQAPAGICPGCSEALLQSLLGGVPVNQCHRCGGVWLRRTDFEHLTADRESRAALVGYLPPAEPAKATEGIHYRPCPTCKRFMNRLNYGRISGVVVDVCREDGVWFDQDELRRVLEFIQAGGLEKARDRQIRELDEARRLEAYRGGAGHVALPAEWTGMPATPGSVLGDLAFELVAWLRR